MWNAPDRTPLDLTIPRRKDFARLRHMLSCLGQRLGCPVRFMLPEDDSPHFVLKYGAKRVLIPYEPDPRPTLATADDFPRLWAAAERVVRSFGGDNALSLNCDILTPVARLLDLREEMEEPRRDVYGLVEGVRSPRFAQNALLLPLFDNLAFYLAQILDVEPARQPAFAVAVSCDVDFLEDDHLPQVLDFFAGYGVHRPTFYLYGGGGNGHTQYDPTYSLEDGGTLKKLEALKCSEVEIGLHGGFLAHDRLDLLLEQKKRVEYWLERPIYGHRAHFFRFAYPRSWKIQQKAGFLYDVSLGYPDSWGSRTGCASPLRLYDDSAFYVLPTMILDQHFFWPTVTPEKERPGLINSVLDGIEVVGGTLVLDWHTYTLNTPGFEGWWQPLREILDEAVRRRAHLCGAEEAIKLALGREHI